MTVTFILAQQMKQLLCTFSDQPFHAIVVHHCLQVPPEALARGPKDVLPEVGPLLDGRHQVIPVKVTVPDMQHYSICSRLQSLGSCNQESLGCNLLHCQTVAKLVTPGSFYWHGQG